MLMVFLLMELGRSLYFDRAEWRHVFLLFAIGRTEHSEQRLKAIQNISNNKLLHSCCLLMLETHAQTVPYDVAAKARGGRHGRGGNHEGTAG